MTDLPTIRELIAYSGVSQRAFAERYMIPLRTVEDWARGIYAPPVYVTYQLTLATGYTEKPHE